MNVGLFILRLAVGIIFIYHALPKIKNPKAMATGMGMPAMMPFVLGLVEFLGALMLIIGFHPKTGAVALAVVMLGAIYFKVFKWGAPFSAMDKTGWELDLILLAANITIYLAGGGGIAV